MTYNFQRFHKNIGEEIILNTVEEPRKFKTSIKNVVIYKEKSEESEVIKTIKKIDSKIIVLGKAEITKTYIDKYKTDRWFKVKYTEKGESFSGFVVATTVRPEWIELDLINYKNGSGYWKSTNNKLKKVKKELIVLHFTATEGTPEDVKNSMNSKNSEKSSHYIIGRDGSILQIVSDFNTSHHAAPENQRSIGIEIINVGPLRKNNKYWENWNKKSSFEDSYSYLYDIKKENPIVWNIWKNKKNHNEQMPDIANPDGLGGDSQYWQAYTEKQYESLNKLLNILNEKTGIPLKFFKFTPKEITSENLFKNSFYYSPRRKFSLNPKEWTVYNSQRLSFEGIVGHKNISTKYDPGPHLDIKKLLTNPK